MTCVPTSCEPGWPEADIFTVLDNKSVQVKGEKLLAFMEHFKLEDSDLSLDWLPARVVTYRGSTAATICTHIEAKEVLREKQRKYVSLKSSELRQKYLDDKASEGVYREADGCFVLLELSMRHKFKISPVAVVHRSRGSWELPEKRSTIVFPRDQLIFLHQQDHESEFDECTSKLSDDHFLSTLNVVLLPIDAQADLGGDPDADASEVPSSSLRSKRPTRRGRGGSKKEEKDLLLPTLSFLVAENWGRLQDLHCTSTDVRIVRIFGRMQGELGSKDHWYPGVEDHLCAGSQCWVMPHLKKVTNVDQLLDPYVPRLKARTRSVGLRWRSKKMVL